MDTYREILAATDGSPTAQRAVDAGARVAAALDVPLILVTVFEGEAGSESEWASGVTAAAADVARDLGVETVRHRHIAGRAADALVEVADQHPGALLVVGARGLQSTAERLLGNVANHVAHNAPGDVLLVREQGASWQTVALATDGSTTATAAVHRGVALVETLGISARLLTAAEDEDEGQRAVSAIVADLQISGDAPETDIRIGGPGRALVEASGDYDLMVVGNKRMTGPSRLLGSVANRVTRDGQCDLLLVNTAG